MISLQYLIAAIVRCVAPGTSEIKPLPLGFGPRLAFEKT